MSVTASASGLSAAPRANAEIIERVRGAKGFPKEIIAAAIVNAKAESGLNPAAVGDSGAGGIGFSPGFSDGGFAGQADRVSHRQGRAFVFDPVGDRGVGAAAVAGCEAQHAESLER